jgi:putative FmdB family regulatory protein
MTIYEFHCNNCGEDYKKVLNYSQAVQLNECPLCHSQDIVRQAPAPALASSTRADSRGGCGGGPGMGFT